MDLALTGIIEREAARPASDYAGPGHRNLPDARSAGSGRALLYFQLSRSGVLETTAAALGEHERLELATQLSWEHLERLVPEPAFLARVTNEVPAVGESQQQLNAVEFNARNRYVQQLPNFGQAVVTAAPNTGDLLPRKPSAWVGPMTSVWLGQHSDSLALIRRSRLAGTDSIQGCILDWPGIRQWLLGEIKDLLPAAQLDPRKAPPRSEEFLLASLPLRLTPGRLANPPQSSAQFLPGLVAAWGGILMAIAAMVALFVGTLALSERRAAFVSAVTHELRTPLTTFRMYTEMLAQGMVPEEQRKEYLDTLHREANRLGYLVENVLAYARLQHGRKTRQLERVDLGALLVREERRVSERAAQVGMKISIELEPGSALAALANPTAIEQVLFNLVDNACKYGFGTTDPRIHLCVRQAGKRVELRVKDHGPGIRPERARRLFEPFGKSSEEAASSAPGVGLGLALSRRLARAMRGDLTVEATENGACFVLALEVA
jgi:signal transduction histidine kinase